MKYCSTQINVPKPLALDFLKYGDQIDKEDLNNEAGGKERNPHVTILYGIKDDISELEKIKIELPKIKVIIPYIKVTLSKLTLFNTNPDFDVLKIDVNSQELNTLNQLFRQITNYENEYPNYHPHLTIAYLKKGCGERYKDDDRFEGKIFIVNKFVFCNKNGEQTILYLSQDKLEEQNISYKAFYK